MASALEHDGVLVYESPRWGSRAGRRDCYCTVGTGFQFGAMKRFWRQTLWWLYNNVKVLDVTELYT